VIAGALALGALLAVQTGLLGLAAVRGRTGRLPRLTLWITRLIVAGSVVVSVISIYSVWWEITTFDYPFTRPGRPLGTYEAPSALGVLLVGVTALAFLAAAALALLRPRLAIGLYIVIAFWSAADLVTTTVTDATFPRENLLVALEALTLPALVIAALVWSLGQPTAGPREVRGLGGEAG
jgi:hypothetical protein